MDAAHVDHIRILEADPDLAAALDEGDRTQASHAALAPVLRVERGRWRPPEHVEPGHMGLLVLGGLLTRTVAVGGPGSIQLLAAGDVLRPWVTLGEDAPMDQLAQYAQAANRGSLADFTKESITDPNAYVQPGFPSGVMPSFTSLSAQQLADLVAFLTQGH